MQDIELLLEIIICPISGQKLKYMADTSELITEDGKISYKVVNGVPIMLASEACIKEGKKIKPQ